MGEANYLAYGVAAVVAIVAILVGIPLFKNMHAGRSTTTWGGRLLIGAVIFAIIFIGLLISK